MRSSDNLPFNPIGSPKTGISGDLKSQSVPSSKKNSYVPFPERESASLRFEQLPPPQDAGFKFKSLNLGSVGLEGKRAAGSPVSALVVLVFLINLSV